jgi:formamidopyrimidine-DNA glycosylase
MPELPEVENFRKRIDPIAFERTIQQIKIYDDYILKMPQEEFESGLIGKTFSSSKRRGKYLFLKIDTNHLLLHFAMSGNIKFYNSREKEPEYSKIILQFEDNHFLSIISVRKFGRVEIIDDLETFIKESKLGPDALKIELDIFKKIMENKRRSYAKTALMDQSAISGIGNLYSDETLFQAHIHPKTKIYDLDEEKIERTYSKMQEILKTVIECIENDIEYPHEYIIPHRDKDDKCPVCGSLIKRLKISSRHAFFCPKCQPT